MIARCGTICHFEYLKSKLTQKRTLAVGNKDPPNITLKKEKKQTLPLANHQRKTNKQTKKNKKKKKNNFIIIFIHFDQRLEETDRNITMKQPFTD